MTKISALTSLAGGSVDAANDVLAIVDTSASTTKKITVADLIGLVTDITGLLDFKGSTDCSANPNYPAASKGDFYLVSVAGKIGGASGTVVEAGDTYFAIADNAGGTQAGVGSSWAVIQGNITSYMPKTGGVFIGDIEVPADAYDATGWDGNNEAPTKNDVRDKIEAIVAGGSYTDEQAQDAVGGILTDSSSIDFTYDDAGPSITAIVKPLTISTTSGATYTVDSTDIGAHRRFTSASAVTVTVNTSHGFVAGQRARFTQAGAGAVTLSASGVTLNSRGALLSSAGQYAVFEIECVGTNEFDVIGDMA